MTPNDALNKIEAELANPDTGWRYTIGSFQLEHFMAGYALQNNGVAASFSVLQNGCDKAPYPALGLLYLLCQWSSEKEPNRTAWLDSLDRYAREHQLLHYSESLDTVGREWSANASLDFLYMWCGFVLAAPQNVFTVDYIIYILAQINSSYTDGKYDNGAPVDLIYEAMNMFLMLYAFVFVLQEEDGLKLCVVLDDIIRLFIEMIP